MSDVNVRLNISAQGDAAQKLRSAADAASAADASMKALAASQQRVADTSARIGSGAMAARAAPSGGAGGGAADQALTGAARDMASATRQLAQTQRQSAAETRTQMTAQRQAAAESAQGRAAEQGAGKEGGLLSGALGKLVGGFVGLQGAQKLLGGAGAAIAASQDTTVDPALRGRKTVEALPFVGGLAKSFNELSDAVDGTTNKLKEMDERFAEYAARANVRSQATLELDANRSQRREYEARAEAFGRQGLFGTRVGAEAPAQLPQGIDRTTVGGEREYEQAVRRLPLEAGARGARLNETAARTELAGAQEAIQKRQADFDKAKAAAEEASRRADEARKAPAAGGGGLLNLAQKLTPGVKQVEKAIGEVGLADRMEAYKTAKQANEDMQRREKELEQAVQRRGQAEVKVEQAASAARQANIALSREKLNVLNEEEKRVSSAAQGWAGLSAAEKMAAENALDRAKAQGVAALSGEERGLLGRAAPQFLGKELEKAGEADPAFKRLQEKAGERSDLGDIRKQQVQLQNKVQVDIAMDEAKLAEQLQEKMGATLMKLEAIIYARMERALRDITAGIQVRQANH